MRLSKNPIPTKKAYYIVGFFLCSPLANNGITIPKINSFYCSTTFLSTIYFFILQSYFLFCLYLQGPISSHQLHLKTPLINELMLFA